ncbi:hypothetical protein LSTR_LSTR013040 [Laodelphax striatellus]|uniref:Uncharacterized protein n=1 Tax=Laodelphax striatellus TaxID=195883 RepID=A0A482XCN1_LAOST|nr:hypothetical protein LSTR_LSTR013040 [Laodelphax striatellus]
MAPWFVSQPYQARKRVAEDFQQPLGELVDGSVYGKAELQWLFRYYADQTTQELQKILMDICRSKKAIWALASRGEPPNYSVMYFLQEASENLVVQHKMWKFRIYPVKELTGCTITSLVCKNGLGVKCGVVEGVVPEFSNVLKNTKCIESDDEWSIFYIEVSSSVYLDVISGSPFLPDRSRIDDKVNMFSQFNGIRAEISSPIIRGRWSQRRMLEETHSPGFFSSMQDWMAELFNGLINWIKEKTLLFLAIFGLTWSAP